MMSIADSFQKEGRERGCLLSGWMASALRSPSRDSNETGALKTRRLDHPVVACDTVLMQLLDPSPRLANDPRSAKINLTAGTGVEIEWKDGHRSNFTFTFLRDACPCALCDDEREKSGRKPGEGVKLAPGALPMFKAAAKALGAEQIGKYALRFAWNDKHDLGIYSWAYLREICPCAECVGSR